MSCRFFVGDKDYCETRNIDSMMEQFAADRQKVLQLLINGEISKTLWQNNSPLSKDDTCLFQMGKYLALPIEKLLDGEISDPLTNFYICPQCKNMKRLIDFSSTRKTLPGEPFPIECGKKTGEMLVYEIEKIPYLYLEKYINSQLEKSINYLSCDPFTNNILINWYISDISPNIIDQYISFICHDTGYGLREYLDIGPIKNFQKHKDYLCQIENSCPTAKADDKFPISSKTIKQIILQLFSTLSILKKYNFSFNNINGIHFKNSAINYIYDDIKIAAPFTLKLVGFHNSAITINNKIRVYARSILGEEEFVRKHIYLNIIRQNNTYKLGNIGKNIKTWTVFNFWKMLGFPKIKTISNNFLHPTDLEAYVLFLSLLTEPSFYATIFNDKILHNLYQSLWDRESDGNYIKEKMENLHGKTYSLEDIYSILSNVYLKDDIINDIWNKIKNEF